VDLSPVPPAFTVVVPAHNSQRTLGSCVQSVLRQTESDLELIIVDDGSTDDTLQVARASTDPRVSVTSQASGGVSAARNAGVRAASGDVVCFLDSDDLLLPHYLQSVRSVFAADPGVDFVYTDAWTFDDRSRRVRRHTTAHYQRPPRPAPADAPGLFRELLQRNFIIVPVAVRRQVITAAGLFDVTMSGCEDWDLWLRLLIAGHRGAEASGPLGLRREHAAQASSDHVHMASHAVYMFEKLLQDQALSPEDRHRVRERLEFAQRELRILSGEDQAGSLLRRTRWRLGSLRRAAGLGARWYREPPPVVTAAFGDLSTLD
jgi:hypothetical protein